LALGLSEQPLQVVRNARMGGAETISLPIAYPAGQEAVRGERQIFGCIHSKAYRFGGRRPCISGR
jgi:hypothetical protein